MKATITEFITIYKPEIITIAGEEKIKVTGGNYAKRPCRRSQKTNRRQTRIYRREYNDINNEGGDGYIPQRSSWKLIRELTS
jgi:hypothetical protein